MAPHRLIVALRARQAVRVGVGVGVGVRIVQIR